jgi:hypothetical protein
VYVRTGALPRKVGLRDFRKELTIQRCAFLIGWLAESSCHAEVWRRRKFGALIPLAPNEDWRERRGSNPIGLPYTTQRKSLSCACLLA